jgi:hypothetical protein
LLFESLIPFPFLDDPLNATSTTASQAVKLSSPSVKGNSFHWILFDSPYCLVAIALIVFYWLIAIPSIVLIYMLLIKPKTRTRRRKIKRPKSRTAKSPTVTVDTAKEVTVKSEYVETPAVPVEINFH